MSTDRRSLLEESLAAIERLQARLDAAEASKREPIAIVGAACRYPGGAETPEQLWTLLRDGINAVGEVPRDRWDVDAYYDADPAAPGKMITRRGGFLRQVDKFDPAYFGISPREAQTLDPQQRLLLETTLEALESAGIPTDTLIGSSTGVFIGITTSDYGQLVRSGGVERSDVYSATGNALNAAAGRIAFTFGFQGPAVAVDTACSSSLVAVHLACRALRNAEADLALAGGVNVVLSPDAMVLFSKWGMLAPDGRCKTFDAAADGFVRAEGCAMIALKRLSTALADRDPILAVIRGSAVNQDGRSSGLTVPNGPAQQAVVRRALSDAALSPADIDYVEAHGTGTPLGDPIELEALGAVMSAGRAEDRPLLIGSVKTNLGHTEAASGLAGLLKVALSLRHEAIPPHLHFTSPNPGVPWERLPLSVPTALTPWTRSSRPRRAGVSSFGFSGTNAHVILEEAPLGASAPSANDTPGPRVVPLSARSADALRALATVHADDIQARPEISLADRVTTLATGRSHLGHRAAIVCDDSAQLVEGLRALAAGETSPSVATGTVAPGERPRIAMLFTGQGSQYAGMARGLYEREPIFRDALDRCSSLLAARLGRSLPDLFWGVDATLLDQTAYTQPALFALEWALAELWRSWGITPTAVLGHSVGEYVAACIAGVFTLEDGLALIAERARLMQALPPGGAMAAIFAPVADVEAAVNAAANTGACISVAALNGPEHAVVSGAEADVETLTAPFAARGVRVQRLAVSHAFHSALLDPMLHGLETAARQVAYGVPRLTLISNVTGTAWAPGDAPDAAYWCRHARQPVRFAECVDAARALGCDVFLEVGPSPTLVSMASATRTDPRTTWAHSLRRNRDDAREIAAALGALYTRGTTIQWNAVSSSSTGRRVALPTYPFQRERHWVETTARNAPRALAVGHPLLGEHRELASDAGLHVWEQEIGLATHPWVRDHRVQDTPIVPATAYIEMAFRAFFEATGHEAVSVTDIENLKPMLLRDGDVRRVQATVTLHADGTGAFAVYSRESGARGAWTSHATATVAPAAIPSDARSVDIDSLRSRCTQPLAGSAFYAALAARGNQWGPSFQGMDHAWIGRGEAFARVQVMPNIAGEVARYQFHPALSDSCGHALVATLPLQADGGATAGAFVGGGVGEVRFYHRPRSSALWSHATLRTPPEGAARNVVFGDVRVYDQDGTPVSETTGARLWYLDANASDALLSVPPDWFHVVRWHDVGAPVAGPRATPSGRWLIFADKQGFGAALAVRHTDAILVRAGDRCVIAADQAMIRPDHPEDYMRLIESVGTVAAIVHLWSLDARSDDADDARIRGSASVVNLIRGLGAARACPRIWLVTAGSQSVVGGDQVPAPLGAGLWGLGRTLGAESPERWGGLVDVDPATDATTAATFIAREVELGASDDKVAQRGNRRLAARLERQAPASGDDIPIRADGTYVITGGLGGMGLAMAQWLAERGAGDLLLVGRTGLPARAEWDAVDATSPLGRRIASLRELEAAGARVDVAAIDVAQAGALATRLTERASAGRPPVRGAIHAAGVLHFQPLDAEDATSLQSATAAKVDGALALHAALAGEPLDFIILCSSTSALLPSPRLGVYASGNACLDSLAHHWRAGGIPALSINWGTWGEVGMAVTPGQRASGEMLRGISTIPTSKGLAAMSALLSARTGQAAVMPVDWNALAGAYPPYAADPFFERLVSVKHDRTPVTQPSLDVAALVAMDAGGRTARITAWLHVEAAQTLGFAPNKLDPTQPLATLGFDSLMAVQLRSRVERELGVSVPMVHFLQGPSVERLVVSLLDALPAAGASVGPTIDVPELEEGTI